MMRWLVIFIIFLTGCNGGALKGSESQNREVTVMEKEKANHSFFRKKAIKQLTINGTFARFLDWYDGESVLYHSVENGTTTLNLFHLYNGKTTRFYETRNPIVHVSSNLDQTLFAIQELQSNYKIVVTILNKNGEIVFQSSIDGIEFQIDWNPYEKNKLAITALSSDWNFEIFTLDASTKEKTKINIDFPFVQWVSPVELAFLDWGEYYSTVAPLYSFNSITGEKKKIMDRAAAFFTYYDLLVLLEDEGNKESTTFSFYELNTMEKVSEFEFPIVNTFSEQWWIPEHDYNEKTNLFYFLKPELKENDNEETIFAFTTFSVKQKVEEKVVELKASYPIKCSPEGLQCLTGGQLETLIDIEKKEKMILIAN